MSRVVMGMNTRSTLPERKHLVAAVHFEHNRSAELAPIDCECGWSGSLFEWAAHAPRTSVSYTWNDARKRPRVA